MIKIEFVIAVFFAASVSLMLGGCKTTGYTFRVETATVTYGTIAQIETLLSKNGYSLLVKERPRYKGAATNDLITVFQKEFEYPERWRHLVFVALFYVRDAKDGNPQQIRVDVYNDNVALLVPEIQAEIDSIGNSIYQMISSEVGKTKVQIKHLEWGPPRG